MDLFEIVSSFIPDEQKDDIKSKIDGQLEVITKGNETKIKKELSKKFGVNLFEEDVEKAFSETVFVKKEKLDTTNQELNNYKTLLEEKEKEVNTYKEKSYLNEVAIKLVKEGFKEERLELIKPILAKGDENEKIEDKIARVKQEVPELFNQSVIKKTYPEDNSDETGKTDLQKYFEQREQEMKNIYKK